MHTPESILNAFVRATELAKRLPSARPAGFQNPWPDILRLGHEGYEQNGDTKKPLTAAEVAEFETTSLWMSFLQRESDRRMLWAYSAGFPGWRIAKCCTPKVSQATVSRRIVWALAYISHQMDVGNTPPGFEIPEK